MKNISEQTGFGYATAILADPSQMGLIFWLGFRPFDEDELTVLLKNGQDEIETALHKLRLNGVVNPIKDDQQKWALTNEGNDLRNILLSLSIWGRHQLDDQEEQTPELIVEPERVADLKELVKFRDGVVRKYLDI